MAGGEKKVEEYNDRKSQKPVGRTGATTRDSSVNASLPGGARPPMASFPPLAAAASSNVNYNVQKSVTSAIPGHGQTSHQQRNALATQQGRNAGSKEDHWPRLRRGSDAVVAEENQKRPRLEHQENSGYLYCQPPPPLPQQRNTREESRDQWMAWSFSQPSAANRPPTAIPSHGQTGHQHGDALGTQQGRNADTEEVPRDRLRQGSDSTVAAGNQKRLRLENQGNSGFTYPQPPPPLPQQRNSREESRHQSKAAPRKNLLNREPLPSASAEQQARIKRLMPSAKQYLKRNAADARLPAKAIIAFAPPMHPAPVCPGCSKNTSAPRYVSYPDEHLCLCWDCHQAGTTMVNCAFCRKG